MVVGCLSYSSCMGSGSQGSKSFNVDGDDDAPKGNTGFAKAAVTAYCDSSTWHAMQKTGKALLLLYAHRWKMGQVHAIGHLMSVPLA